MLIVISAPGKVEGELQKVRYLFDNGLQKFHIRKPEWKETELEEYIQGIDLKYHSRLVIHQQQDKNFGFEINSVHLSEKDRQVFIQSENEELKLHDINLSTSIHSMKSYAEINGRFEYCYLSPVFDSISKKGYLAMNKTDRDLKSKNVTKVIALGGVNSKNAEEAFKMGFDGVAVLGSIWENENWKEEFHLLLNITGKRNEEI